VGDEDANGTNGGGVRDEDEIDDDDDGGDGALGCEPDEDELDDEPHPHHRCCYSNYHFHHLRRRCCCCCCCYYSTLDYYSENDCGYGWTTENGGVLLLYIITNHDTHQFHKENSFSSVRKKWEQQKKEVDK
jgi:hypothetical protein